jgi:ferredoxin--NADP+ reductase
VSHADVPVNLYKPKDPFVGTVTENYSLLAEGAIGRVNHITFDLSGGDPSSTTWRARASASFPMGKTPTASPTSCASIRSPAPATATTWPATPCRCACASCNTRKDGETINGVCSTFLCDIEPGAKVKITGPVGKEMLLPAR